MIRLEPFEESDFDRLIQWCLSSDSLVQWGGPAYEYPLTREQLKQHLEHASGASPECLIYKALRDRDGAIVGHGELGSIDRPNLSAKLQRILVGPMELRGRGLGTMIVRSLLRIAFQDLRLHRVSLYVFDFHESAIRCYERAGFKHEGRLRDVQRHGREYWSAVVMSMLRSEWPDDCEQTGPG